MLGFNNQHLYLPHCLCNYNLMVGEKCVWLFPSLSLVPFFSRFQFSTVLIRRVARILHWGHELRRQRRQVGWQMGREYPHPQLTAMHFWHIWGPQNTSGRENSVTLLNDVQIPESDMFIYNENYALKPQTLVSYIPIKPVFFRKTIPEGTGEPISYEILAVY